MAVKDDAVYCSTESIISRHKRRHFRVPVRSQHWQLRSLISVEKQHIVYFPGGTGCNHVQRLNTLTSECETIKLLAFAPRCLVADNGWLCCGSENGDFVAIQLDSNTDRNNSPSSLGLLDSDLQLPSAFERNEGSVLSQLLQARRSSSRSLLAKSVRLAKDRVNCITLWFPPSPDLCSPDAYSQSVAVLANNDRTVTLVGLQDVISEEKPEALDVVNYPDYVNRAIISPDGGLLVAILDDPYLYVHQRTKELTSRLDGSTEYRWVLKQRLLLKSQRINDETDSRGSFAACFSASGTYLAVGTQHGTISIFDATLLTNTNVDPLITTFKSSRPESGPGAIRDMAFCPGPFDILAWTEDRGRVGIADARTNFVVRQIIDINAESDFQHVNVVDPNTIDPRLLEGHRSPWRASTPPLGSGNADSTRRGEQGSGSGSGSGAGASAGVDALNPPLTTRETQVLEAIQNDRRRRERGQSTRAAEDAIRAAVDLTMNPRLPGHPRGAGMRNRERSSSISRTTAEPTYSRETERILQLQRERNARILREATDLNVSRRNDPRWAERVAETIAILRERDRSDTYLNVLEVLQGGDRAAGDDESGHDANQGFARWEENIVRGSLVPDHGIFEVPPSADNTAGLSWSEDGRTLFVGAQNGLYEFHINVHNRKFYPSISLR